MTVERAPVIELRPVAPGEAHVLRRLFELYVYDFSETVPLELKDSGSFEVTLGDEWWTADHHPFFVRRDGTLVGFALARKGSRTTSAPDVMDVAEFFIVRGARTSGVGRAAAHLLFRAFPGRWEIRVRRTNAPAKAFWTRVADAWVRPYRASAFTDANGVAWDVLHLDA